MEKITQWDYLPLSCSLSMNLAGSYFTFFPARRKRAQWVGLHALGTKPLTYIGHRKWPPGVQLQYIFRGGGAGSRDYSSITYGCAPSYVLV